MNEESAVTFETWTGGRGVRTIGTNAGAQVIAFQAWRHFKEAFAPEIVERAARETRGEVTRIVDPFGGSGTTALAAQFLGIRPTTIEVNPFLADLIEAKLSHYDLDRLAEAFADLTARVELDRQRSFKLPIGAPATLVAPGVDGRYIFSKSVFERIAKYKRAIEIEKSESFRRFFRVHLAAALIPCSNVVVSGKGRRYRSNWDKAQPSPQILTDLFEKGVLAALYDLRRYESRKCRDFRLLRGDARKLVAQVGPLDLAVFSPPYPNSFDYTDVYNVELWALDYLTDNVSNRTLREATLRSHVQIKRDLSADRVSSSTLKRVVKRLQSVQTDLWNESIPSMVAAYTHDMQLIMQRLHNRLRTKGRVYMVVGDSRYNGIDVPVAKILTEEATAIGYKVRASEGFRSMRSSPQQGGQHVLAESLIVLEKP